MTSSLKRAIDLTSLPETKRGKWSPQEDDALLDAYHTYGNNWKKAEDAFGEAGNRRLIHHSRASYSGRLKRLQAEQVKAHGKVIDHRLLNFPVAASWEPPVGVSGVNSTANLLKFTCICRHVHTWKSLLLCGIQCQCSRTKQEMLAQLEAAFDCIVYIILAKDSIGLSDPIEYVGFSTAVKRRLAGHNHESIRSANFNTIRISIVLGESAMITLLRPTLNVQGVGNRQQSQLCHIWNAAQNTWIAKQINTATFKYDTPIYDHITACRNTTIARSEDYNTTAGILFTETIRHPSDDIFCFLKNPTGDIVASRASPKGVDGVARCACTPILCSYRKILNALQGRTISDGIEHSLLKDVIKPYRPIPVAASSTEMGNPTWTYAFIQTVIRRNDLKPATIRDYDKKLLELWDNGTLRHFDQPWMVLHDIEKLLNRSAQGALCTAVMCLASHLTTSEYRMLFPASSAKLRLEYQRLSIHISAGSTVADRQRQLSRQTQNWAETQEIEKAISLMESTCASVHDFQKIVWLRLQLYHECVPTNLNNVKISQYDIDKDNYFDHITGRLIINNEPSRNIRSRETIVLDDRVASDVVKLYQKRVGETEFLFARDGGLPFTSTELSTAVKASLYKYLKKHIGAQMLRKICRATIY